MTSKTNGRYARSNGETKLFTHLADFKHIMAIFCL